MNYWEDEDYWNPPNYGSSNINAPKGKHIMNKNEGKLCRKLMAETGLTEEELREDKKYRKMLSAAQKEGTVAKRHPLQKLKDDIMKSCTKELGLAKEHPKTKELYAQKVRDLQSKGWWRPRHSYGLKEDYFK